jgi:hypothetical protein
VLTAVGVLNVTQSNDDVKRTALINVLCGLTQSLHANILANELRFKFRPTVIWDLMSYVLVKIY